MRARCRGCDVADGDVADGDVADGDVAQGIRLPRTLGPVFGRGAAPAPCARSTEPNVNWMWVSSPSGRRLAGDATAFNLTSWRFRRCVL